jgi:alkanesulfonate monooxygenase SsuD/methylene tetrahydromethanopterin reductase-like flavin-dependent oxidoreductase (luciferase family)
LPFNADLLDPHYLLKNTWIVGSPSTVREKLEKFQEETGGFGTLLVFACDYGAQPEVWRDSLRMLAEEVVPKMSLPTVAA